MKARVYTRISKESVIHKNHFVGVTIMFSEKLDSVFDFIKWVPDNDPRPRFGIAVAKLIQGPRIIITNLGKHQELRVQRPVFSKKNNRKMKENSFWHKTNNIIQ